MPLGQWTTGLADPDALTPEEIEHLAEARRHDESFGPNLPDHYQGPWDRRRLLAIIDKLQRGR